MQALLTLYHLLQRLLEKMNKSGVMYKPAAAVPSADNDVDEDLDSFKNGPYEKKEFVYKDDIDSRGEPVIDMTQPDEVVPNHKTVPEVLCIYIYVYNFLLYFFYMLKCSHNFVCQTENPTEDEWTQGSFTY